MEQAKIDWGLKKLHVGSLIYIKPSQLYSPKIFLYYNWLSLGTCQNQSSVRKTVIISDQYMTVDKTKNRTILCIKDDVTVRVDDVVLPREHFEKNGILYLNTSA